MKPKIPAIRVKSDDCAINVGQVVEDGEIVKEGTPHYVHKGEWVEILPVITVKEVMQISKLQNAGDDASGLGENLTELCKELSRRVIKWNWTDLMGCLPSQVLDEDWQTIRNIMDYRLLSSARDQHNQDASQMVPAQIEAWTEMVEAVESDG